jgi:hypothetical protein
MARPSASLHYSPGAGVQRTAAATSLPGTTSVSDVRWWIFSIAPSTGHRLNH